MPVTAPVIVVPGITASYLRDEYPLPAEDVWTVVTKEFERVLLHPDDRRYEAVQPARVAPGQIYEIAYQELIEELRYNLTPKEDKPVPVFPFAYDWRQPLADIEESLAEFIAEVADRTRLLQHYHDAGYAKSPKVNLVGHSMGGLIIAGYLQKHGKKAPVNKVATLASPFQGSFEAVIKVITGTANLGTSAPSSREREAARVTPALYHLLPSFSRGLEITGDGLPRTLYDPNLWQRGVIQSIEEFIRLRGLRRNASNRRADAAQLFADLLKQAKAHRNRINRLDLAAAGLTAKDWLCVVGVGAETRVRLKVEKRGGAPFFNLSSKDRMDEWESKKNRRRTGDGTVPLEGAVPKFLEEKNLVCVSPDDYGYWELQDKALTKAAGFHGILPNMNMLHRMLVRFFTGASDSHKNTWGTPMPGVAKKDWAPALKLEAKG